METCSFTTRMGIQLLERFAAEMCFCRPTKVKSLSEPSEMGTFFSAIRKESQLAPFAMEMFFF